jgi:uncharacterized protein (DUF302 family)
MRYLVLATCVVQIILLHVTTVGAATLTRNEIISATTSKAFRDVIDDLEYAITDRNFRITGRNTIGTGIQAREHPSFPNMEIVHFCSLENARELLEIDPTFLVHMPCRISAREHGKLTIITAPLLPTAHRDRRMRAYIKRMNTMIREIVSFAAAKP